MGLRLINVRALKVLNEICADHAASLPLGDRQVKIYQALAETLPTKRERLAAAALAKTLSLAAAKQMEFAGMSRPNGNGHSELEGKQ